jgi:hypothetical protein
MSHAQEERRERLQNELSNDLDAEAAPLHKKIRELESQGGQEDEIERLMSQARAIYAPHEDFLTKV